MSELSISPDSVEEAAANLAGATKLWKLQGREDLAKYTDTLIAASMFGYKKIAQQADKIQQLQAQLDSYKKAADFTKIELHHIGALERAVATFMNQARQLAETLDYDSDFYYSDAQTLDEVLTFLKERIDKPSNTCNTE